MRRYSALDIFFIVIVCNLAVDNYLPSLPQISQEFHTSLQLIQSTVGIQFAGYAAGCLVAGIGHNRFSLKKILLTGAAVLLAGSLLCYYANGANVLWWGRLIQGLGCGLLFAIANIMVVLLFSGNGIKMARLFTMIGMLEAVMPSISPYLGSIAAQDLGWRINFLIMAGLACVIIVSLMTGKIQQQHVLHENLLTGLKHYFAPMKSWRFVLLVSAAGCGFGGYIAYLSLTPDLYQHVLRYSMLEFGRISFFTTLMLLGGALCNMLLLKYVRIAKIVSYATLPMLVGSLGLWLSILFVAKLSLWAILIPSAIFIVGQYFVLLNCIAYGSEFVAEQDQANAAGAATFMLLLIASVVGTLASLIRLESEWVLAGVLLGCAVVASVFIAMIQYRLIPTR